VSKVTVEACKVELAVVSLFKDCVTLSISNVAALLKQAVLIKGHEKLAVPEPAPARAEAPAKVLTVFILSLKTAVEIAVEFLLNCTSIVKFPQLQKYLRVLK
jgi:hypothetical protein